ncbi:4364_t:CDS:1, partial [Acaulospora morrowiae]
ISDESKEIQNSTPSERANEIEREQISPSKNKGVGSSLKCQPYFKLATDKVTINIKSNNAREINSSIFCLTWK